MKTGEEEGGDYEEDDEEGQIAEEEMKDGTKAKTMNTLSLIGKGKKGKKQTKTPS